MTLTLTGYDSLGDDAEVYGKLLWRAEGVAIRTDQNRVVNLMGHASKQMIYEVYDVMPVNKPPDESISAKKWDRTCSE